MGIIQGAMEGNRPYPSTISCPIVTAMGFRFHKSISFGKFLRLNLSKSGASIGVGPRGLNFNIGPRGIRRTVGLPGTGLYYQETSTWPKSLPAESAAHLAPPVPASGTGSGAGWMVIVVIVLVVAMMFHLGGGSPASGAKDAAVNMARGDTPPLVPPAAIAVKADRPLTRDEVRELQTLLRGQGFATGTPDGILGPKTRAAAQTFARAEYMSVVHDPSLRILEAARRHVKPPLSQAARHQ